MRIVVSNECEQPIYRQIVESVAKEIRDGALRAGERLPTVRDLARETGISRGTVKHAYDELEQRGLIEMTQGRGTFVRDAAQPELESRKEQAMQAIDALLDELEALGFSEQETRIFLDLKLREREETAPAVRVGVVDCNPEALSAIHSQLSALPGVDLYQFLLEDVLASPYRLGGDLDLVITTANHFSDLETVASGAQLTRMVLSTAQRTVMDLAKTRADERVGILCVSAKFAGIIRRACGEFCTLDHPPETCYLGEPGRTKAFAEGRDVLIVPPDYLGFCTRQEADLLRVFRGRGGRLIRFDYQIDRGSLLFLSERIDRLCREKRGRRGNAAE